MVEPLFKTINYIDVTPAPCDGESWYSAYYTTTIGDDILNTDFNDLCSVSYDISSLAVALIKIYLHETQQHNVNPSNIYCNIIQDLNDLTYENNSENIINLEQAIEYIQSKHITLVELTESNSIWNYINNGRPCLYEYQGHWELIYAALSTYNLCSNNSDIKFYHDRCESSQFKSFCCHLPFGEGHHYYTYLNYEDILTLLQ